MNVTYANKEAQEMCTNQRYQKQNMAEKEAKKLQILVSLIIAADDLSFFLLPENRKFHIEKLSGNRTGQMSLRIAESSGYRLIFRCTNTNISDEYIKMISIDIDEVTNHEY